MSKTLHDTIDAVLYRLGDTSKTIWSEAEVESYLKEAYDDLAIKSLCFWDHSSITEEVPNTSNYTAKWEVPYFETGDVRYSRFSVTAQFEDDYDDEELEPGNHTSAWEWEYLTVNYINALVDVPEKMYQIERAISNNKRIEPVTKRQLEADGRYEFTEGPVEAYAMQYDGLRKLRKYRKPTAIDIFTVTGMWGLLRDASDATDASVTGTWGVPRIMGGVQPSTEFDGWGIPRRVYKSTATRIEYFRRGKELVSITDEFEFPDMYVKYLRHYAMSKALGRDGSGQDSALAEHYMARYLSGISRLSSRKSVQKSQKIGRIGDGNRVSGRPPKPVLPSNYGRMSR
jgi:hypothetical protein